MCQLGMQGLDVMPMISPTAAENRPSLGQPTRLRLTGRTKLSGRLSAQPHHADSASQLPASAFEGQLSHLLCCKKRARLMPLLPPSVTPSALICHPFCPHLSPLLPSFVTPSALICYPFCAHLSPLLPSSVTPSALICYPFCPHLLPLLPSSVTRSAICWLQPEQCAMLNAEPSFS